MASMTESASTDFSALRSKFSSEFSTPSYSSPSSTTMKRSPSVSSSPASSYKSYTNAIAEYTATVERLRSRRNSMQDASNARRDSSLRASSSTGLPSSSAIASRRPSYVSSYVAPSTVARSSDYIAKTASSSNDTSSLHSSAYADRIISRVDKLLSQHYSSASDGQDEDVVKKSRDSDVKENGSHRRSSYLKSNGVTDSTAGTDYTAPSKYATLPNRKTYSREESLEKAREIVARNTGRKLESSDDTSSTSNYSSRRLLRGNSVSNTHDSGLESLASSRAPSFDRSTSYCTLTNGNSSRRLDGIHSSLSSGLPSRETSPVPSLTHITKETDRNSESHPADASSSGNRYNTRESWEIDRSTNRLSRDAFQSDGKERQLTSSSNGYRRTRLNSTRDCSESQQESSVDREPSSDERANLTEEDWSSRSTRGRSPTLKAARSMQPSRKSVAVDETDTAGLVGLKNIGNTCFMNSILQCLSNTKSLRDYCTSGQYQAELNASSSHRDGPLISAFATVLEALWKRHSSYSSSNAYDPDRFHRKIQQYAPRFSGYLQQDAQEFLRYLLEGLHEDVNRVTTRPKPEISDIADQLDDAEKSEEAWKRYLKRDNSKIVELYVGQLKSCLTCQNCGNCSVTYDAFWDLALPIPGYRSSALSDSNIYDCLKFFTKKEIMDGDERPNCSKCQSRQLCTKFFSIQRFPKCLVIHLKRFSQERYRAKISSLVEYPIEGLDLSPFAADSYTGACPKYNLFALSCHAGSTHCGHYTAFCKHPISGKWNEYNDSRVSSVSARDVVTSDAYVLFYQLVN